MIVKDYGDIFIKKIEIVHLKFLTCDFFESISKTKYIY
jgi:hypothetical protein